MTIRRGVPDDIDALTQIDEACFPEPWGRTSFEKEIVGGVRHLPIHANGHY